MVLLYSHITQKHTHHFTWITIRPRQFSLVYNSYAISTPSSENERGEDGSRMIFSLSSFSSCSTRDSPSFLRLRVTWVKDRRWMNFPPSPLLLRILLVFDGSLNSLVQMILSNLFSRYFWSSTQPLFSLIHSSTLVANWIG